MGSGRIGDLDIGTKAAHLDMAHTHGIAVPAGFVIPDGAPTPSIEPWIDGSPTNSVAVRSAFAAEDRDDESLAGWFTTVLGVGSEDFDAAVLSVRASADVRPGTFRRDVLVMDMVAARTSGVAFSEPETYDDRVNVTSGTAERLVAGHIEGTALLLARLERAESGWQRRLQRLLRSVRHTFGDRPWDIEWADDGEVCWLVQIRPITAPTRRNDSFTIANHAEILPPLPSHLMTSVIEDSGPDLFGWYRTFDPSLPADRAFLEVIAGRPFINLSLLEDMLRHLGLPTALVADSIGGPPDNSRPARPLRMLRKLLVLAKMGLAQVRAVRTASANQRELANAGHVPAESFTEVIEQLRTAYVGLVTGMFPLSSAIGPPLAILRRSGTLIEHASRHRTITTHLAEALDAMQRSDDPAAATAFLNEYGHRGVFESDISRPRYDDDPSLLGEGVARPDSISSRGTRTVRGLITAPIWWVARRPLAAREELRHEAMRGFANLRRTIVRLSDRAVADGRLPTVDHVWLLDTEELQCVDRGWSPDATFWRARLAERATLAEINPPPIVRRFDDPASWNSELGDADRLRGLPLTEGNTTGRAWVLSEPSVQLPEGFTPESTVLVARSIDAGWIPTLSLVAAAVVEIGGDLSHGSILLRERGLPAITNIPNVTKNITTGDLVEVRAGSGSVARLERSPKAERT